MPLPTLIDDTSQVPSPVQSRPAGSELQDLLSPKRGRRSSDVRRPTGIIFQGRLRRTKTNRGERRSGEGRGNRGWASMRMPVGRGEADASHVPVGDKGSTRPRWSSAPADRPTDRQAGREVRLHGLDSSRCSGRRYDIEPDLTAQRGEIPDAHPFGT